VSDFLAVRPEARNLGLAAELKRLQAGIALSRGFEEIVWTVDPLRAANARLNFGKLGAIARTYEIDRYGSTFAASLYGGVPSDRLHVTWDLTAPRVVARLLSREEDFPAATQDLSPFTSGMSHDAAVVTIPADIDALLSADPADAIAWRFRLRNSLIQAFSEGFAITGFRPAADGQPAFLLERLDERKD
jgi:predicted GNAT superfamily acetyltransferase